MFPLSNFPRNLYFHWDIEGKESRIEPRSDNQWILVLPLPPSTTSFFTWIPSLSARSSNATFSRLNAPQRLPEQTLEYLTATPRPPAEPGDDHFPVRVPCPAWDGCGTQWGPKLVQPRSPWLPPCLFSVMGSGPHRIF